MKESNTRRNEPFVTKGGAWQRQGLETSWPIGECFYSKGGCSWEDVNKPEEREMFVMQLRLPQTDDLGMMAGLNGTVLRSNGRVGVRVQPGGRGEIHVQQASYLPSPRDWRALVAVCARVLGPVPVAPCSPRSLSTSKVSNSEGNRSKIERRGRQPAIYGMVRTGTRPRGDRSVRWSAVE